jgi:hypothetical protein
MHKRRVSVAAVAGILSALVLDPESRAQPPGPPPPPPAPPWAFQVRLGSFFPEGDSNFWNETESVFTLRASDFDDFVLGLSFVGAISNQVELGINLDFYHEGVVSSYADWVDESGFPIPHDTYLSLYPLTADVRFVPGGRYRIRPGGRHVVKPVFYIGAGLGLLFWDYEEEGYFLDFGFDPPEVFWGRFVDSDVTFEMHALAGVEVPISRGSAFLFETRYSMAEDNLEGDFFGLPATELDLGGPSVFGGIAFRF